MKKVFTCMIALCMLLSMLPAAAFADGVTASGTCGSDVSWELSDGTLTISGNGIMKNYDNIDLTPWEDLKSEIRNVVIGDGVENIGSFAFADCANLQTVTIGKDVQRIGHWAFQECKKLAQIDLPQGLTQIGYVAFQSCSSLTEVVIPDGVTVIGSSAFRYCSGLTEVVLPAAVTEIGSYAFDSCSRLSLAAYSGTMEQWDLVQTGSSNGPLENALWFVQDDLLFRFEQKGEILRIDTEGALPDYEEGAAPWNKVAGYTRVIVLDEAVTGLGENVFAGFSALQYIRLGDEIAAISDSAFSGCEKLTIHTPQGSYAQKYAEETGIPFCNQHDYEEMIVEVNCEDDGFALYTCTQCKYMVYENFQPAYGHDFQLQGYSAPTCTEDGYAGWTACTRCGLFDWDGGMIPATGHSWGQWEETVKPDATQDGVNTRTCTACGETETETVAKNPFTDVKADRFEDAILWAYYEGITSGTGDGTTFSPEAACTRKQIVTFLWRAAGEPEPKNMENPFTDVKADRFEKAILWAYYEGITSGTGDGSAFSPEDTCTRKQIVTFLWRFHGGPAPKSMENNFTDVKNDRFAAAILWAAEQGITTGTGDGTTFSPEAPCTRKQIVTFLYRDLAK